MSEVTFKPNQGRCLILPDEAEKKTESGIIIPDSANTDKPITGVIVADGLYDDGFFNEFSIGDRVGYPQHAVIDYKIDGVKYALVRHALIDGTM